MQAVPGRKLFITYCKKFFNIITRQVHCGSTCWTEILARFGGLAQIAAENSCTGWWAKTAPIPKETQDDPWVIQDDPWETHDDPLVTQGDPCVTQVDPLVDWLAYWITDNRGGAVELWSCYNFHTSYLFWVERWPSAVFFIIFILFIYFCGKAAICCYLYT